VYHKIRYTKSLNTTIGVPLTRAAPILPANFLEKYVGKNKKQNAGNGRNLENRTAD